MSTQSLNKPTSRLNTVNQSQRKNMIATNRNNMDLAKQKEFAKIQNFKPEAY
jgi:hypothetical protein